MGSGHANGLGLYSRLRRHPLIGAILAVLLVAIYAGDLWGLWSSDPLIPWIVTHTGVRPMTAEILLRVFAVVAVVAGLAMLAVIIRNQLIAESNGPIGPLSDHSAVSHLGVVDSSEFIPLPEAARIFYEHSREKATLWARAAEQLSNGKTRGSPEEILDWIATYIQGKIPIFGSRPPSERQELIADRHGQFESGALIYKTHDQTYTALAIRRHDLQKVISTTESMTAQVSPDSN